MLNKKIWKYKSMNVMASLKNEYIDIHFSAIRISGSQQEQRFN